MRFPRNIEDRWEGQVEDKWSDMTEEEREEYDDDFGKFYRECRKSFEESWGEQ